ncbi:tyrosine-type recombinase/integrase [Dendrosporobacter sp. 1207_IL3150]|uniref:tyrosine-type recombinase/integrase n=1 Tax=Dendrosporobacter sp. 1207_IL3150 TaxID=3084054 RepID=UPI002FD8DABB
MDVTQAQDIFLISRKARNLSKNTIFWYKLTTDKFILYCQKINKNNIEAIKSHNIEEFMISIRREISDRTLKDNFVALRTFFNFLFDEEYIPRNPMKNMRQPKVEQKVMRTFGKQEIEKMLKYFDRTEFIGLRNFVIIALLFSNGMRKAEFIGIKTQDVNITVDMIKVRGKGNKERSVPI